MTVKKICGYNKYGYCKLKDECKDYHPTEVCIEPICNIAKCEKRHPQPCRYFRTGNCRFRDACKYDHKEQINSKELLDRIIQLENENKDVKELKNKILKVESENKNLNDMNKLLYERLTNVENEYINFLKRYSEDREKEDTVMVDVTSVNDDGKMKISQDPNPSQKKVNDVSTKSRKRKSPSQEEDKKENVKKQNSGELQEKEVGVYVEVLKKLALAKLQLKRTKTEISIKNFKSIKDKLKTIESYCGDDSKILIGNFEATYTKWLSYHKNTFNLNAVKDIDNLMRMIQTSQNL